MFLRLIFVVLILVIRPTFILSQEDDTLHPPVIGFALTDEHRSCCPQNIKVLNPYNGSFIIIKEQYVTPETLQFSPNAHFVSYISMRALHIYDLRQQKKVNYTKFPIDFGTHRWSPDGQTIAILGRPQSIHHENRNTYSHLVNLYLLDLKSWELTQVTKQLAVSIHMSWSLDSTKLLFSANATGAWGASDIYILDVRSLDYTNITKSPGFNVSPSWSLDGTRFVHVSGAKKPHQLIIRDANFPYEVLQIISLEIRTGEPEWTLDDEYIAFFSNQSSGSIEYMINLASDELTPLARKSPIAGFDVSPDGENAVYMTTTKEHNRLCIVDLLSLEEQCLEGENPFFYEQPVWGG